MPIIPQWPEGLQQACFWKFPPYPYRVKLQNKPLPSLSRHSWVCILHYFCFVIYLCVCVLVCVHMHFYVNGVQKSVSDPLELELQVGLSSLAWGWEPKLLLEKSSNHWARDSALCPPHLLLIRSPSPKLLKSTFLLFQSTNPGSVKIFVHLLNLSSLL